MVSESNALLVFLLALSLLAELTHFQQIHPEVMQVRKDIKKRSNTPTQP